MWVLYFAGYNQTMTGKPKNPLVISYPRSGVNWFSRAFETLTGARSPGQDRGIVPEQPAAFKRTHSTKAKRLKRVILSGGCDSALLLLRDPAWSYVRRTSCGYPFRAYLQNIHFYHWCPAPKKLVYFEDLFTPQTLYDIVEWMGFPYTPFKDFKKALAESKAWYHKQKHPNYVRRNPTKKDIAEARRRCIQSLGKELVREYLGRYIRV